MQPGKIAIELTEDGKLNVKATGDHAWTFQVLSRALTGMIAPPPPENPVLESLPPEARALLRRAKEQATIR